jgi:hypothetical protein
MDGIIWLFLALTVALVAFGVVLAGRRRPKSVDGSRGHCSNCATPMSLRRVPFFKSRAVLVSGYARAAGAVSDREARIEDDDSRVWHREDGMNYFRCALLCSLAALLVACGHNAKPVAQPKLDVASADSVRELLAILKLDAFMVDMFSRQSERLRKQIEEHSVEESLNAEQKALAREFADKALAVIADEFSWPRFEPLLVATYQDSYSPQDVDALIVFYRSDQGRGVLNKVPQMVQVVTSERIAEWHSIRQDRGEKAVEDKVEQELGVVFTPSEMERLCTFYESPIGKHITARTPQARRLLEEHMRALKDDVDKRSQALAADYRARINAAASAK